MWLSRLAIAATTMSARKSSPPITVSAIVITSTYKCATPPPDRHRPKVTHRGGHSASEAIAAPVNVTLVTSGRRGPDDPPATGTFTRGLPGCSDLSWRQAVMHEVTAERLADEIGRS